MKTVKITTKIYNSTGTELFDLGTEEMDYTSNVDMDIELELVHDTGGPIVRPKEAPKF